MHTLKHTIGKNILEQRLLRGLSQDELADLLGITRQSISKWELGTTLPTLEKMMELSHLLDISPNDLLLERQPALLEPSKHILDWGLYLLVKDFSRSVHFYEQLLNRRHTLLGGNRFAQFRFNGNCILSIMNEGHLQDHHVPPVNTHKFVLNLFTPNLGAEFARVKALNIGPFTDIQSAHPSYHFFNLVDPDYNLIEITGEYFEQGVLPTGPTIKGDNS